MYLYLERFLYTFSDEGIFTYGAIRIINGEILYKDFFASNSPLNYFLLAFLYKIFSPSTTVTLWTAFVVLGLISVMIYLTAKEVNFSNLLSYFMVIFFIITKPLKFFEYSHHWLSLLSALFSIYFFLRFTKKSSVLSLISAGFFAGITTGFFHPKGILLMFGFMLSMVLIDLRTKMLKSYVLLLFSYFFPLGILILYFLLNNALYEFFYYLFIWPVKNYNFLHKYPGYYYPTKIFLSELFESDKFFYGLVESLPVLFIGYNFLISSGILTGVFLLKGKEILYKNKLELIFFIMTFFLFFSTLYRPDDLRMAVISPVTNICFFLILFLLCRHLSIISQRLWLNRFLVLLCILIPLGESISGLKNFLYLKIASEQKYFEYNTSRGSIFVTQDSLNDIKIFTDALKEFNIDRVFIYPCLPSWYFLLNLRNPTRFDCIFPFYNSPREFDLLISELNKEDVRLVVFVAYYLMGDEKYFPVTKGHNKEELEAVEPMLNYLYRNYVPVYRSRYVYKPGWSDYFVTLYLKK